MHSPLVGVLALQGAYAFHARALDELGAACRLVRRADELEGIDALVVPGGESTTIAMLMDSAGLVDPIGERLASGLPVFGTCAGMILLAAEVVDGQPAQPSFGAIDITVRRNASGRQVDSFEEDIDVEVLTGGAFHGVFIRAPSVLRAGPDVEVLARTRYVVAGADAGHGAEPLEGTPVLCRSGVVLVSAFHPELTEDRRLHRLFLDMVDRGMSTSRAIPTERSS